MESKGLTDRENEEKNSVSMRSDRNEDTMRPIAGQTSEQGLELKDFGAEKHAEQQEEVQENYMNIFRTEVDFHHKVAYRFEKAYRLGKKVNGTQDRKANLNNDIIQCIVEHADYIETDPMALFYCLFFCIYFKNEDLVEFLRELIHKIHSHEKIDRLLEYID